MPHPSVISSEAQRSREISSIIHDDAAIPHDENLESAVLGALLLEPQAVADVRQVLTRDAFYKSDNAAIYDIICRLDDRARLQTSTPSRSRQRAKIFRWPTLRNSRRRSGRGRRLSDTHTTWRPSPSAERC